jgi:hypothetical protein
MDGIHHIFESGTARVEHEADARRRELILPVDFDCFV